MLLVREIKVQNEIKVEIKVKDGIKVVDHMTLSWGDYLRSSA